MHGNGEIVYADMLRGHFEHVILNGVRFYVLQLQKI